MTNEVYFTSLCNSSTIIGYKKLVVTAWPSDLPTIDGNIALGG